MGYRLRSPDARSETLVQKTTGWVGVTMAACAVWCLLIAWDSGTASGSQAKSVDQPAATAPPADGQVGDKPAAAEPPSVNTAAADPSADPAAETESADDDAAADKPAAGKPADADPADANPADADGAKASPDEAEADKAEPESAEAEADKAEGHEAEGDEAGASEAGAAGSSTSAADDRGKQRPAADPSRKLNFNFRHAPWDEVLEWFAEEADLEFALDITPTGTFNYVVRDREYTISEAMDVLNSMLMMKGYTLVRRDRMLLIVDLEDEVDASWFVTCWWRHLLPNWTNGANTRSRRPALRSTGCRPRKRRNRSRRC